MSMLRPTKIVRSFWELQAGLRALGCGKQKDIEGVHYVLKKAAVPNVER